MKSAENRRDGALAEDFAAEYLAGLGHEILCRNFTVRGGEVDIISADGEYIVFTEVKKRSGDSPLADALAAVTREKVSRIKKCAESYMKSKDAASLSGKKMRIDVIAVTEDGAGGFCVTRHIKRLGTLPKRARRF